MKNTVTVDQDVFYFVLALVEQAMMQGMHFDAALEEKVNTAINQAYGDGVDIAEALDNAAVTLPQEPEVLFDDYDEDTDYSFEEVYEDDL